MKNKLSKLQNTVIENIDDNILELNRERDKLISKLEGINSQINNRTKLIEKIKNSDDDWIMSNCSLSLTLSKGGLSSFFMGVEETGNK